MKNRMLSVNEMVEILGPVPNKIPGKTPEILTQLDWESGTINDLFTKWLRDEGYAHVNTFNGRVWFSRELKTWESYEREVSNNRVTFYLAI